MGVYKDVKSNSRVMVGYIEQIVWSLSKCMENVVWLLERRIESRESLHIYTALHNEIIKEVCRSKAAHKYKEYTSIEKIVTISVYNIPQCLVRMKFRP